MRPLLYEVFFNVPVTVLLVGATLVWSAIVARKALGEAWGPAFRRAVGSLLTFGSRGSSEKADISVPGSLGTIMLAAGVYGLTRGSPVRVPIFGYAAMVFCGFTATSIAGWRTGPRLGVEPRMAIKVAFLCAFFGIVGARAYYVVQYWDKEFAQQPAHVDFGRIAPVGSDTLEVRTNRGSRRIVFTGNEKTPKQVLDALDGPLEAIGAHARLLELTYKPRDTVEVVQRGFAIETVDRGDLAELSVSGSLVQPIFGVKGWSPPWWQIFAIWNGGLVYYGGMIFGTLAILVFVRVQGYRVAQVADLASSVGAIGVAFGRVGCFLNGCCWGRRAELPWSVRFPLFSPSWIQHAKATLGAEWDPIVAIRQVPPPASVPPEVAQALHGAGADALCQASWPLHPVQVYAILLDVGMFLVIYPFVMRRVTREWQTFALWFVLYAVVRFVIEHFRGDYESFITVFGYSLTNGQQAAVLTLPVSIAGFIWASKHGRLIERWKPPEPAKK